MVVYTADVIATAY